ncbi:MAG: ATP-binding domain-containing protein [Candidatus Thiodiazotropha sp.]
MTENLDHVKEISTETLDVFENVAARALAKVQSSNDVPTGQSFASMNTATGGIRAVENLDRIHSSTQVGYRELANEPAISRVVALDENDELKTFYIARRSTISLDGAIKHASYGSPVGRLASLPVGEVITLNIGSNSQSFVVLEKAKYCPVHKNQLWDSINTVFEGDGYGPFTVESISALIRGAGEAKDAASELDALLAGGEEIAVLEGIRHVTIQAMALRDQPILDKFQDGIFRLPIDSQLLILGPPGTGKTTTLIKRLGQKIDREFLEDDEKVLIDTISSGHRRHELSWIMFTPTDLLKHFVKEAFSREQVPASDERIKTWESHRGRLARNVLGILQSSTVRGKFILKTAQFLKPEIEENPIAWFDGFTRFHRQRVIDQLQHGVDLLIDLKDEANEALVERIVEIMSKIDNSRLLEGYRSLDSLENDLAPHVKQLKSETDEQVKKTLLRTFNANRNFLNELAAFIDTLAEDDEVDGEEEFDDEESEAPKGNATTSQKAGQVYNQAIKSLARQKFLKRSVSKSSRAYKIREWLGDRFPNDADLKSIGRGITLQNGLRRFINASKRYVAEVPNAYKEFRRLVFKQGEWYQSFPDNMRHITPMELDAIILLMLRSARDLLGQTYITSSLDEARYFLLKLISDQFYNQVLVDEATDFSPLQLACMESLAHMDTRSFFACGDFNQRITQWGTRSEDQIAWIGGRLETRSINIVYRQSQKLNEFAVELLKVTGGNLDNKGVLPEHMVHEGFAPVLVEQCSATDQVAAWLFQRIQEIERSVQMMPTVAVLVNDEDKVKPLAESLNSLLEDINLRAVACSDGQSLGEGTDVRVFDVQHIKGLEFEGVFFIGVDELEKSMSDLFGKYLYVGATRAATYFGMTSGDTLPGLLEPLRDCFVDNWL